VNERIAFLDPWPRDKVLAAYAKSWPRSAASPSGAAGITGPIGSGKTRATFNKLAALAMAMPPSPVDGIRRFRLITLRTSYPELWRTTIPTWNKVFPPGLYPGFVGSKDRPAQHVLRLQMGDGLLEFDAQFLAPGEDADMEAFFSGLEATCIYLNELATFPGPETVTWAVGRCGRYPDRSHGSPPWFGVVFDANKGDVDSWMHDWLQEPRPAFAWFDQPSGLSPAAENLANLPEGYYARFANDPTVEQGWFRRMVLNEWAPSRSGRPVYETFDDRRHMSPVPLVPRPEYGLVLGADGGRRPAVIVLQWLPIGRWLVLDEIIEVNMGAGQLAALVNRRLRTRFPAWPASRIECWADPSTDMPGEASEDTWLRVMRAETGLSWRVAPGGNAWTPRYEAVDNVLRGTADDGGPAILIDPRCRMVRGGLASKYHFPKFSAGGETRYGAKPVKNDWSHPIEGLQYGLLGGGEYLAVMGRRRDRTQASAPITAATDFNPLGGW
jgi:hypothetical protein